MLSYDLAPSIARDAEEVKVAAGLVARFCAQETQVQIPHSYLIGVRLVGSPLVVSKRYKRCAGGFAGCYR